MEEVVPGSAAQVIRMSVDQGKHRRELEKTVVGSQIKQSGRGQWLGFSIAIIGLAIAGYLIESGHDAAGATLGTADIVGLVSIFVLGRLDQKKELDEKKK
jgi:uncharacterized membrane protein